MWQYISDEKIPINPLYNFGYNRIGCIGCPMSQYKGRVRDFARYPKYKERYIRIAEKLVEKNRDKWAKKGLLIESGIDYFRRWIEDPNVKGQYSFDMDGNITEDYT